MISPTERISFGDPRVDRHHLIICNAHSIFPSTWSYALLLSFHWSVQFVWFLTQVCQAFIDRCNLCSSSCLGISSYRLTLFLYSSSQNLSFSQVTFKCQARCCWVLMLSNLPTGTCSSLPWDWVNIEMHSERRIDGVWKHTWQPWLSDISDALGGRHCANFEIHSEAVIEDVCRIIWNPMIVQTSRPSSSKYGDTLSGCNWARLKMQSETIIERAWRYTWKAMIVQAWRP